MKLPPVDAIIQALFEMDTDLGIDGVTSTRHAAMLLREYRLQLACTITANSSASTVEAGLVSADQDVLFVLGALL